MLTAQDRAPRILLAAQAIPLSRRSELGRQAARPTDAPHQDEAVPAGQRDRQVEGQHTVQVPLARGEPRRRGFLLRAGCESSELLRRAPVLNNACGPDAQPVGR